MSPRTPAILTRSRHPAIQAILAGLDGRTCGQSRRCGTTLLWRGKRAIVGQTDKLAVLVCSWPHWAATLTGTTRLADDWPSGVRPIRPDTSTPRPFHDTGNPDRGPRPSSEAIRRTWPWRAAHGSDESRCPTDIKHHWPHRHLLTSQRRDGCAAFAACRFVELPADLARVPRTAPGVAVRRRGATDREGRPRRRGGRRSSAAATERLCRPRGQMIATLSAWGPFWPWLTSKDTRWPSSKAL